MPSRITGISPESPLEFWQPNPSPAQPGFVNDDDSDGWWSGIGIIGAAIALAAFLAAPAVAVQQYNDELRPVVSDDDWHQIPSQPGLWTASVFTGDDALAASLSFGLADEYWNSPVRIMTWHAAVHAFAADEEILPPKPTKISIHAFRFYGSLRERW